MSDIEREQSQKEEAESALAEARETLAALPTEDPEANDELEAEAKQKDKHDADEVQAAEENPEQEYAAEY